MSTSNYLFRLPARWPFLLALFGWSASLLASFVRSKKLSKEKVDQRIDAWEKVVDHPLWKDCFEADGTLIDEMLAKMDRLWAKENPMPTVPGTVFRATEIRGKSCDVKVMVADRSSSGNYISSKRVEGRIFHDPEDITAWEPIENGVAR